MTSATFTPPSLMTRVTRFRFGRILAVLGLGAAGLIGGALWLLHTQGTPLTVPSVDATAWPAWMRQQQVYPTTEAPPPPAVPVDTTAAQLAALRAQMEAQHLATQQAIEELRRRPTTTTTAQAPVKVEAAVTRKPPASMLYVSHDVQDTTAKPTDPTYTILPGYFVPCIVETAMNSDTGDITFVAVTTTTVWDTATGRFPLIPQGSKIVGEGQGSVLLYGNELLKTVSLTLSRRQDTQSIELGQAPITNQTGVNGLASRVDQHFWRLLGAVVIGGALRGGTQALQTAISGAGPVGQIGGGIAQTGQQAITQRTGPALNTRPTIEVDPGQLCNVLLTKPLTLTVAR